MKTIIIILVFCCTYSAAQAQTVMNPKVKYFSWIHFNDNSKPIKGVILETNDSTIQFIEESLLVKNTAVAPFTSQRIPITSIKKIRIRKKGAPGKGALIGAGTGVIAGNIIGFASGDDECDPNGFCFLTLTAVDKAAMGAAVLLIPGLLVGAVIGSNGSMIHINGDQSLYANARTKLKSYALINQESLKK